MPFRNRNHMLPRCRTLPNPLRLERGLEGLGEMPFFWGAPYFWISAARGKNRALARSLCAFGSHAGFRLAGVSAGLGSTGSHAHGRNHSSFGDRGIDRGNTAVNWPRKSHRNLAYFQKRLVIWSISWNSATSTSTKLGNHLHVISLLIIFALLSLDAYNRN